MPGNPEMSGLNLYQSSAVYHFSSLKGSFYARLFLRSAKPDAFSGRTSGGRL